MNLAFAPVFEAIIRSLPYGKHSVFWFELPFRVERSFLLLKHKATQDKKDRNEQKEPLAVWDTKTCSIVSNINSPPHSAIPATFQSEPLGFGPCSTLVAQKLAPQARTRCKGFLPGGIFLRSFDRKSPSALVCTFVCQRSGAVPHNSTHAPPVDGPCLQMSKLNKVKENLKLEARICEDLRTKM